MNRYRRFVIPVLAALVGLFLTSTVAMAQFDTDTNTSTAGATIVAPIALSHSVHLNFGQIVPHATLAGTVLQSAAASPTRTPTNCTLGSSVGMAPGTFTVTGGANATYAITLPANGVVSLDDGGAGDAMAIDDWTSLPSATGTLNGGGTQTLYVGATLNIGAAQLAGAYTDDFDVIVTYN